jgi:hypothetical protein
MLTIFCYANDLLLFRSPKQTVSELFRSDAKGRLLIKCDVFAA